MCLHGIRILNFHGIRTDDVLSECLVGRKKSGISVNVLRREEMKEEQKSSSYFFRLDFEIEMTQNIISRLMHFRPSTEDNSTEKYEIKQFLSSSRSCQNDWRSDEPSCKVLGSNPVPATFLTPRIHGPEHYHWNCSMSNSTSMYLFATVCCQQIHQSQIRGLIIVCKWVFDVKFRSIVD